MSARRSLLVAATVVATVATATPSYAAGDVWRVPQHAKITIKGHGYGHGHGMSQYGAEGAAREGLKHRRILAFYYPGTKRDTAGGRVTVALSADTTDDLIVNARDGLTVRDTRRGKRRITLPDKDASRWRIAVDGEGVNRVSYRTRKWHSWRVLRGQGEFYAGGDPITLVTPSGERAYRGRLRVGVASGDRVTINDLSLESYLKGVVPLEIPASWSREAVRAQAVAARTYAAYERDHPRTSAYQICDTTSCQVYGGVDAEHPASNRAVEATEGTILTFGGEPAFTQFSSSSGGWTAAGSQPYLPAKKDRYDGWAGNPVHSWSLRLGDGRLERAWPQVGDLRRIAVTRRDGNGAWGGRVETIVLRGTDGRVVVSGDTFRTVLGLRSTWVTFRVSRRGG
jgi:SpoIID/LytB domain protein